MNYSIANYSHAPVSYSVQAVKATWTPEVINGPENFVFADIAAVRRDFQAAERALDLDAAAMAVREGVDLLLSSEIARSKHNIDEITASIRINVRMLVVFAKAQLKTIAVTPSAANKAKIDTIATLDRYLQVIEGLF